MQLHAAPNTMLLRASALAGCVCVLCAGVHCQGCVYVLFCRCRSKCVCCQYGAVLKVGQPSVCDLWGGQCRHVPMYVYRMLTGCMYTCHTHVGCAAEECKHVLVRVPVYGCVGGRSVRVSGQGCDRQTAWCVSAGWAGMHLLPAQCACVCVRAAPGHGYGGMCAGCAACDRWGS